MVFALSTVVGFACPMGVNMGFNSRYHYEEDEATEVGLHTYKDGERHNQHEKKHSHSHDKEHKHDQANNYQKSESGKAIAATIRC